MSLLQKASIITTPTAYAEDYLYSIKPAYALGSELVTNGGFESSASWTVSGTDSTHIATFSNGTLRYQSDTTSPQLIVAQASVLQTGRLYKITVNVTTLTSGYVKVDSLGGLNITPSAGTNIFYKTATGTTFNITRGTTNVDVTIDSISVVEVTDADFDFDRNSTGTRVNEDYLIEDVPYNLVSYSEDFSNSGWTKENITILSNNIISPDGTLNGDKISETATNTYHALSESINISSGNYTISVFAKLDERQYMLIRSNLSGSNVNTTFDLSNGLVTYNGHTSASIESAGKGWYRCSVTSNSSVTSVNTAFLPSGIDITNNNLPTYLGVVGSGLYIYGAQIVKGDQPKDYLKTTDRLDIPRIDYTNGEPSILLEPSRTNSNTYSEDLSQWTAANGSVSTDLIVNPTGNTNKSYWIPDSSNAFHHIDNSSSVASGQQYTISIFLKVDGSDFLNFAILNTSTGNVNNNSGPIVNIKNGTKVGFFNSDYDVGIISYGNGWHRYAWTVTTNATTLKLDVNPIPTSSVSSYNGNGSNGIYVYGLQVEAGSYATSLIHTSGSAVTRSADAANNAGNSDLINSTEGVLYVEASSNYDSSHTNRIAISDGTSSNRISLEWDETTENRIRLHINTHSLLSYDAVDLSIQNKVAVKYAANDYAIWFNGREVVTQASGALPTGMDVLEFTGAGLGSAGSFYGNAKSVMVFKEALSDTELEKLTGYNNHELYMNYYNRLSYLGLAEEYNVESDINNYIL
jgi:hypothetical protein